MDTRREYGTIAPVVFFLRFWTHGLVYSGETKMSFHVQSLTALVGVTSMVLSCGVWMFGGGVSTSLVGHWPGARVALQLITNVIFELLYELFYIVFSIWRLFCQRALLP